MPSRIAKTGAAVILVLAVALAFVALRGTGHRRHARPDSLIAHVRQTAAVKGSRSPSRPSPTPSARQPLPHHRWEATRLVIPSIDVNEPVQKGTGNWRYIAGPAYEIWSAGPGGAGNTVIASHRNMGHATFGHLPRVRPGEPIYLVTGSHRYTYRVDWSHPVQIDRSDVLDETDAPTLTLYTCVTPFDAARRWVVRGHLAASEARATASRPSD